MFNEEKGQLHVVMFPWLAFGHISPFVQLSNRLSSHGVKISFFTASANVDRVKTMLHLTPTTQIIPLFLPHVDGLPLGAESTAETSPAASELLKLALDLLQPQVKILLSELKPHLVFFDFALQWIPSMSLDLGIKTVFFSVFSVLSIALVTTFNCQAKHPAIEEIMNPPPPLDSVPMRTFEAHDLSYIFKGFNGGPCVADRLKACLDGCTAILFKSCREMEASYIDYLSSKLEKPVLLSGPMVPETQSEAVLLEEKWATWLGRFSPKSVIYCSFGSESFLEDKQIQQLALGLELTGFPFFLVLNFPASLDSSAELQRALPEGFLERVKDRGIVHSGWVQQRQILAHGSVGCCVCHAGFSSVIEALVNDCQLVLLPLKGDQFCVAKQVQFEWKAGLDVNRKDEDGYFGKDDVCDAVRKVMSKVDEEPAKAIRANHKKLRDFLLNNEMQSKFVVDLLEEMKVLTGAS